MHKFMYKGEQVSGSQTNSNKMSYDNTTSGLTATNAKAAIDEVSSSLNNKIGYPNFASKVAIATDSDYTVTEDGFLYIECEQGMARAIINDDLDSKHFFGVSAYETSNGYTVGNWCAIQKGDIISGMSWVSEGTPNYYFVPIL